MYTYVTAALNKCMEVLYIQYMIVLLYNQVYNTKTFNPVVRSIDIHLYPDMYSETQIPDWSASGLVILVTESVSIILIEMRFAVSDL